MGASAIFGSEASGEVSLILRSLSQNGDGDHGNGNHGNRNNGNGNHVPDTGSTLTLLGIALGVVPFMRRR
jgi:VPDSG-CTERM motif